MLRRLLVAVTFTTGVFTAGAAPADAHADACVIADGALWVYGIIGLDPNIPTLADYDITIREGGGGCVASEPQVITGTLFGSCGRANMIGRTNDGHEFGALWTGPTITITGEATGDLAIIETPLYPLCIAGAARAFTVAGSFTKTHLT